MQILCASQLRLAFAALSHKHITLSAAAFRLGRHFRLSRRRDPARVGVSHTVQVESSLLHCSGIDELSNEGTFRFRPTSCEQRQKHSNDPLSPRMCQFLFAKFYSNVDVSNSAQTSPLIGCSGESGSHIRYVNGQSSAAPVGVWSLLLLLARSARRSTLVPPPAGAFFCPTLIG
jgi:hypothetical protein